METYQQIMREYSINRLTLYTDCDLIEDEITMEANFTTFNGSLNTKNGVSGITDVDIFKRIEQVIAKLLTLIENSIMTISTSMKRVMETNIGFERRLREMKESRRPIKNAIKRTIYNYNLGHLESVRQAVTKVVLGLINQSNNAYEILYKDESENVLLKGRAETEIYILEAIAKQIPSLGQSFDMTLPTIGANIKGFMNYVKASFRGHKVQILVSGSDVAKYVSIALGIKGVSDMVLNQIKLVKAAVSKIKSSLRSTRANVMNPEEKRKLAVIANSVSAASNIYITFYRYYHNLRLEQAFVAREIVTDLYQMPKL